jgi:hypothetical protein
MADNLLRQSIRSVSLHLLALIAITTLGPLQFGYHLVCSCCSYA